MRIPAPRSLLLVVQLLAAMLVLAGCRNEIQVTLSPVASTVEAGARVDFTGEATGADDPRVLWSVSDGRIDPQGVYIAPFKAGSYEITARSMEDQTQVARGRVIVLKDPSVAIVPATLTLQAGTSHSFAAETRDMANPSVQWNLNHTGAEPLWRGSFNMTFRAPSEPGTYQIVARSSVAPEVSTTATITVTTEPLPAVNLTLSDLSSTLAGGFINLDGFVRDGSTQSSPVWSAPGVAGGITSGGMFIVPEEPGLYYVSGAARSDRSRQAFVAISVTKPETLPLVSITPFTLSMRSGDRQSFQARVFGAEDREVTWSVQERGGGAIDQNGVYTAPATATSSTFHILATSRADPSRVASAPVYVSSVSNAPAIVITPNVLKLPAGGSAQLSAQVMGAPTPDPASWRVVSNGGGTITQDGRYTAPSTPGVYWVSAESGESTDTLARITVE